jgi:hypothetical protein
MEFENCRLLCRSDGSSFDDGVKDGDDQSSRLEPGLMEKETAMRFMVIVKADKNSEAGVMPSHEILAAMGKYNEELVKAGVMLGADGLHPSSKGARVKFEGPKRTVTDGPFAETKELIAGYWIWKVASKQEAIDWLKRAPFGGGTEVELRQIFEMEDFGKEMTPELREQEKSQMQRAEANKKR